MLKAYTDYPFVQLGDEPYKQAPIREIEVLHYDGNKYCRVKAGGLMTTIKHGYIYTKPGRSGEAKVVNTENLPRLSRQQLDEMDHEYASQ